MSTASPKWKKPISARDKLRREKKLERMRVLKPVTVMLSKGQIALCRHLCRATKKPHPTMAEMLAVALIKGLLQLDNERYTNG